MQQHILVDDFQDTDYIEGVYALQNAQLGMTRSGKPFLKTLMGDKSGQLPARMWSITEEFYQTLPSNGFFAVKGQVQAYQGSLQVILQNIKQVSVTEEELRELLPSSSRDAVAMMQELTDLLDTIEHPAMRGLIRVYMEDEKLMRRFRRAPAAMMLHHAHLSGLLEHTLQVCRLADVMLPFYPGLNRDIVLVGLFLHDMAKCSELTFDAAFGYSDEGQLLGHLIMGSLWLQRKADDLKASDGEGSEGLTKDMLMVLHHIIVSHHTRPEYGAAKIPATPEAVFIARLDELDAKTEMVLSTVKKTRSSTGENENDAVHSRFSEKIWALETKVFQPDPLA